LIRAFLGRSGAYFVVALIMIALAVGGLAERMCRPARR
jgi:hypothetical protein